MLSRLCATLLLGLAAANASAGSVSSSVKSEVGVSGHCIITSPETLSFGSYDLTGAHRNIDLQVASSIQVQCTSGTNSVVVYVDKGLHDNDAGCASNVRRLRGIDAANNSSYIPYILAHGPGGVSEGWGCAVGAGVSNGGVETGIFKDGLTPKTLPVHGMIERGSNQQASSIVVGNYSDTINFFVNF